MHFKYIKIILKYLLHNLSLLHISPRPNKFCNQGLTVPYRVVRMTVTILVVIMMPILTMTMMMMLNQLCFTRTKLKVSQLTNLHGCYFLKSKGT